MHGYAMTGFVAHVSRGDNRAYAIVSVDPCLMTFDESDGVCNDTLEALEPLLGDCARAVAASGSAVVVMNDLEEAGCLMREAEDGIGSMPDMGLVISVLVRGHVMLDLRQEGAIDPELPLAPRAELM